LKFPALTPWHVLERRQLVRRSFLTLWEDKVRLASGAEIDDFCVVDSPDWAAVLCITPERQLVLVRQYRHGLRGPSLELPAGALEPGEEPLAGAQRELAEETGYASDDWQRLLEVSVDPARARARAHFYCALGAQRTRPPQLDASEDLEALLLTRDQLFEQMERGELVHGLHIAAILMAEHRGLL
jgi:8-oxo-dGTP pyrophosphatase MutT (NUDIX family)